MSVYNTPEDVLQEAIDSILLQTWKDLEFIIVDDCSNEPIQAFLHYIAQKDKRIVLLRNQTNSGLARSLNLAIGQSRGEFIARMDSDDVALLDRLEKQVAFLREFQDVDVLGTEALLLTPERKYRKMRRRPNLPWQIQGRLPYGCQGVLHPSVLMRASLFRTHGFAYNEEFKVAQDFELWSRIGLKHKIYVLPDKLMLYRQSNYQVSVAKKELQVAMRAKVILNSLEHFHLDPTEEEKQLHIQLAHGKEVRSVKALDAWVKKLIQANRQLNLYDHVAFEYYTQRRRLDSVLHAISHKSRPSDNPNEPKPERPYPGALMLAFTKYSNAAIPFNYTTQMHRNPYLAFSAPKTRDKNVDIKNETPREN